MLFSQHHRFVYEVTFKPDSTSTEFTTEHYILDVDSEKLWYFNEIYAQNDSLVVNKNEFGFNGFKLTDFVIRDLKTPEYNLYQYIGDINVYLTTRTPQFQWELGNDVKEIDGLKVQNAYTNFGGRAWEAWFCNDIMLPYGPYLFSGLPGLIIELKDTKNNYQFKLIKSINQYDDYGRVTMAQQAKIAIEVSSKQLLKLKKEHYDNPFKSILNGDLEIPEGKSLRLDDGTIINKDQLKPAEEKERLKIRAKNNPIELDQAVKY